MNEVPSRLDTIIGGESIARLWRRGEYRIYHWYLLGVQSGSVGSDEWSREDWEDLVWMVQFTREVAYE